MKKYILGIDPGLSGAMALYAPDYPAEPPIIIDMPTHEITVNRKKKRSLDLWQASDWIYGELDNISFAIIEKVHAMPKQGVTSSFNFGFAAGAIQGIVAAHGIPNTLVSPNKWKQAMGLTADKDASRRLASQMFPNHAHMWARKKDDGRAEALLLAVYGSKLK